MQKNIRGVFQLAAVALACLFWGCGTPADVQIDLVFDQDGDGVTDDEELARGTDPASTDTDGDGYDDSVEIASFTDPTSKTDHPYAGGWPIDACRNDIQGTHSRAGGIAEQFELTDQNGETLRLHDFCDQVVLIVSAALW